MGMNDYLARHEFDAHYKGIWVQEHLLTYPKVRGKWPVAECMAVIDHGANIGPRISVTRVAVGTVIWPGVGTIVGALAMKDRNKIYLGISVPGDMLLIELKSTKEAKAREFARKVNQAAAHFRSV